MTRTKLTPLQDLRADAERLGLGEILERIEAEIERRSDHDLRMEALRGRVERARAALSAWERCPGDVGSEG